MVKKEHKRCSWCGSDPLYITYHDEEWGVPESRDAELFERLVLEGMQAGLSWLTILRKRANMRERFFGFDPDLVARAGPKEVDAWLQDPGIIRHRGKLEAMVGNARAMAELDGGLGKFLWSFVNHQPQQNRWRALSDVPAATEVSKEMAKALKKTGFRFVGPTTCYAFMQSAGLVNDHLLDCDAYERCREASRAWQK